MSNIDKRALREAAEKATPGRIGDRIDGSGSIKYQCFGNDGSLVLQTDHKNMEYGFIGVNSEADELFFRMCDPATVLALLDELEAKDKRIAELEAREINLPPYSFFDFKQGSPFKSGAYCHIDSVNKELSKHCIKMIAAAGKGDAA
ncbi:ead/Ea22-like family protein [Enterobacter hormaechei]|uniref:ead/Ea22-like family protein n=1 Tax=Enterobacter hormaechei TaxID=158836 RepID=UPI000F835AD3|nr:ead/Ea22-like family protein [Enterobacter hormaechei]MBT1783130.1 ead/Ea22-like family protein [Enterobacter hormaechei subsp. xiangfangensis]RTN65916.1 ead/Ea22-like family protein [Enterobacter hormaechei]